MSSKQEAAAMSRRLYKVQEKLASIENRRGDDNALDIGKRRVSPGDKRRKVFVGRHGSKSRFGLPSSPSQRATSVDGKVTFHFKQTSLGKSATYTNAGNANGNGRAGAHASYIERDLAVEQQNYIERTGAIEDGSALAPSIFSNIGKTKNERVNFWKKVQEVEREPRVETLALDYEGHEAFWHEASQRPDTPKALQLFVDNPTDIHIPLPPKTIQAIIDWASTLKTFKKHDTPFRIISGRGGRIQHRLVAELPHEISQQARSKILKDFVQEFEKRDLPYTAVIHAPDEHNDDRNFHVHIIYYDRPSKKMDDGKWDFEVVETYKNSARATRTRRPHLQSKDRDVNKKNWVPTLREKWANIANTALKEAGIDKQYDHRSYKEMGIIKTPSIHLGTNAAALEAQGIATENGVLNAIAEHSHVQTNIDNKYERDRIRIQRSSQEYLSSLDALSKSNPHEYIELKGQLASLTQKQMRAALFDHYLRTLEAVEDRSTSRATRTLAYVTKVLDRIEKGKAEPVEVRRKAELQAERETATQFINQVQSAMKEHADDRQRVDSELKRLKHSIRTDRKTFEQSLGKSNIAIQTEKARPTKTAYTVLNKLIDRIASEPHRITIDPVSKKYIVPSLAKKDQDLISSLDNTQARLQAIKVYQDREITRLQKYILTHPHEATLTNSSPPMLKLSTDIKAIKTLYSKWGAVPEVIATTKSAIAKPRDDKPGSTHTETKVKRPPYKQAATSMLHPYAEKFIKLFADKTKLPNKESIRLIAYQIEQVPSAKESLQKANPKLAKQQEMAAQQHANILQQKIAAERSRSL